MAADSHKQDRVPVLFLYVHPPPTRRIKWDGPKKRLYNPRARRHPAKPAEAPLSLEGPLALAGLGVVPT